MILDKKEDRKSAQAAMETAEAGLAVKMDAILGADNATLVNKVNDVVASDQKDLRGEYKAKLKDAKGDKEATAALRKEMTAKAASSIRSEEHTFELQSQ